MIPMVFQLLSHIFNVFQMVFVDFLCFHSFLDNSALQPAVFSLQPAPGSLQPKQPAACTLRSLQPAA